MANTHYEPTKKIEPVEGLDAKRQVQLDQFHEDVAASDAATKVKFDAAMDKATPSSSTSYSKASTQVAEVVDPAAKPSPMDVVRSKSQAPSLETLRQQALDLRQSFEKPRALLMGASSGSSTLPTGVVTAMNGHLQHADSALQAAASGMRGVEVGSLMKDDKPPMVKFLQFLTDGDHRINTMINDLSTLTANAKAMTPQVMMAAQIKLGFVQQELEFFTNVLNKGLESTKTVMNVQI